MDKFKAYIEQVSQTQLAELLGVTKQAVNHWATGRYRPSLPTMRRIIELSDGELSREDIRPDIYGR